MCNASELQLLLAMHNTTTELLKRSDALEKCNEKVTEQYGGHCCFEEN